MRLASKGLFEDLEILCELPKEENIYENVNWDLFSKSLYSLELWSPTFHEKLLDLQNSKVMMHPNSSSTFSGHIWGTK